MSQHAREGMREAHAIALWKARDLRALSKTFFSKQTAWGLRGRRLLATAGSIEDAVHWRRGRAEFLASSGLSVTELEVVGRSMNL